MSHNTFNQFNDLVTRLATADGTVAAEHSHEILDTELAREVLEAIVGGQVHEEIRGGLGLPGPRTLLELQVLGAENANPYDGNYGHYGRNPKGPNGGTRYF